MDDDNKNKCPTCGKPMVSIFGTSRVKWCPACENRPPKDKQPKRSPFEIDFDFEDWEKGAPSGK